MDKEEFLQKYFQYYLALEDDFIETTRYVQLSESNYKTFSIEYTKQYQAICSEIDVLCKEICKSFGSTTAEKFPDYTGVILSNFNDITSRVVNVGLNSKINLKPFKDWKPKPNYKSPQWWTDYNSVKHERNNNFENANLENVLNSLSGLYMLEKYFLKDICNRTNNEFDIPDKESQLFEINNWKSNMISIAPNMCVKILGEE
ncbi:hypothetical protein ACQPUL_12050 [Clostridium butyricum]|uniref:hypothetical protein n=1 Tax=Clostridium TaxID=1485 RepID=UPI00225486E7|nr:hypothetical protein [Clostridium sp. LQ25]UZT07915.1 hypothetical protein ONV75_08605 [Clostridium sp. LQ25]